MENSYDLQPQRDFSAGSTTRRRPSHPHLPFTAGLHPDVLRVGKDHLDAHPHPPRIMGPDGCCRVVRLDSLRDVGMSGNHPPAEDVADTPAGGILQSPLALDCGVSAVV